MKFGDYLATNSASSPGNTCASSYYFYSVSAVLRRNTRIRRIRILRHQRPQRRFRATLQVHQQGMVRTPHSVARAQVVLNLAQKGCSHFSIGQRSVGASGARQAVVIDK